MGGVIEKNKTNIDSGREVMDNELLCGRPEDLISIIKHLYHTIFFNPTCLIKSQWSLMFMVCEFSKTMTYFGGVCFVIENLGMVKLCAARLDSKSLWLNATSFTD